MEFSRASYKYDFGNTLTTDVDDVSVHRASIAHYNLTPAAVDADGIASITLGAAEQTIESGFGDIPEPRNVTVTPSAAAVTATTVKVYGVDFAGEEIDESFTTNGTSEKTGSKAFAAVTKVDVPIQGSTPAKQKATVAVTQGAQAAGTTVFTFTSAATGEAFDISVEFSADDDTTSEAATVLAAALNNDETFNAAWTAASATADVTIESNSFATQDPSVELTVKTAGESAITLDSITVDTESGVAEDVVNIGWGKKIGIPYKIAADELVIANLFDNEDDAGAIANSATDLCSNTFAIAGTPDGEKDIDIYLIV